MTQAEAIDLVNAVSAYAPALAGLLTVALALTMTRQPWRWLAVYFCVLIAGLANLWYHALGTTFAAHVADVGAALLLLWMLQVAVVGDYYPGHGGRRLNWLVGLVNLECIVALAVGSASGEMPLLESPYGDVTFAEVVVALNCVVTVALIYARLDRVNPAARPLLGLVTVTFAGGLLMAAVSVSQLKLGSFAYHAAWHTVAAFGFVSLWAFNERRFSLPEVVYEVAYEDQWEASHQAEPEDEIKLLWPTEPLPDPRPETPATRAPATRTPAPSDRDQIFSY